jgi:hypothetical protein
MGTPLVFRSRKIKTHECIRLKAMVNDHAVAIIFFINFSSMI